MAFALVGTAGTAVQTAAGGAASPTWGASENRTANNLLLAFVTVTGVATLPATPAGWTIGRQVAGTSCSATVYYKVAAGADAAPVIAAITSGLIAAHLEEWSGGSTVDQVGSATGTSSPVTATLAGVDDGVGGLVAMAGADRRSTARATVNTWTSNNGTPVLRASNNSVSSLDHYSHATLVTTSAAAADTAIMTLSITTSVTGLAVAAVSFTNVKTITLGLLNASNQMYAPTLSIVPTATAYQQLVVSDGPVGYWKLDEASGTPIDSSGNGRPGYTTGVFTQGVTGMPNGNNAVTLAGGGTVSIIPTGSLALTTPFTIEVWVKLTNGTSSIGSFGDYLWGKGSDQVPNLWIAAGSNLGKIAMSRSDQADVVMTSAAPTWGTSWHHVVATYVHSTEAKIYFDGVAQTTGAPNYGTGFGTNAMDFAIGSKWAGGGGTDALHGTIDEVAIYQRALSAAEVLEHYTAGVTIPSKTITLPLLDGARAQYDLTVTTDSYLTVPLLTSASALYQPTLVGLAPDQAVTLGFLDAQPALYAPGLVIDQFLTVPLLSTIPDLYPPDLLQASTTQDVTLGLIDGVPSLYSPTLTPKVTVTLSLLDSPAVLYQPSVLPGQSLAVPLLTSTALLYGPILSVGPASVFTPLIDAGPDLYGPVLTQVAPAAGTITLGLLDAVPALFPPTTFLDQFVVAPLLDAVPALFAPSVQPAPTGVTIPLLTSTSAVYSPTVTVGPVTVLLSQLVSTSVLYAPLLSGGGSVTLSLTLLDSPAVLYAPSLSTKTQLTLPLLTSLAVQYNLSVVAAPAGITLSLLDSGRAVYSPQLSAINPLTLPHLSSVPVLYPPSVDDDIYVWTPLLSTIPDLFAPVVFGVADEAGERLAYNITKQEFWPRKPHNVHVYPLRKK